MEFKDGVLLQLYERHPAFLAVIPVQADAQVKALPPNIVDNHICDRVARLERQRKAAHALVHFGDIVLQAGSCGGLREGQRG